MSDIKRLEALYARVPKMKDCKGLCADTCTVIPITGLEKARIEAKTGQVFKPRGMAPFKIKCSALAQGLCTVYELRPLICRLFGTIDHPFMRCEHGCLPERWVSAREFQELWDELEDIAGKAEIPNVPGWPRLGEGLAKIAASMFK